MAKQSEVRTRWVGRRQFVAIDEGGQAIVIDASVEGGGRGEGFRPSNLLLAALAGCTGYDVVNILEKQRQRLTGLDVRVRGSQQPDPPWTFTEIHVDYVLRGENLDPQRVKRAIELSEASYCSVSATVSGRARITSAFRIEEG